MRKKIWILCILLPAYTLFVLHSIIPHHHVSPSHEIAHSAHEHPHTHPHDHHHHNDQSSSTGHPEKDHHFTHSPEFGEAVILPGVKWTEVQEAKAKPDFWSSVFPGSESDAWLILPSWHSKGPLIRCDLVYGNSITRGPPSAHVLA